MERGRKRLRISSEVILTQESIRKMYFTVDDEVAKLGNITEKGKASDVAGTENDMWYVVK